MKLLLKQVSIITAHSPFNGQTKDILITDGVITQIADTINSTDATVVAQQNLCVSIGWMDIFASFGDPGFEYKETLETGAKAAAAGGFTDVMLLPNTNPVVHSKSQVEYITQKSKSLPVNLYPIGAVTQNADGNNLAEMYDMHQSGAIAFGDGTNSIQAAGILLKALQYVKSCNATIIQVPDDKTIGTGGLMNEGIISTQLGIAGKPAMAEEIMVARDIKLARYTESKLHLTGISSAKSLAYVKRAKEAGLPVSCSVTPQHLYFTDEALQGYDTNLKTNPPLRTTADKQAILDAIADGTVDCIASHHQPQNWDSKFCEFEYAAYGMISLETMFGVLYTTLGNTLSLEKIIALLTVQPRNIFGLSIPPLQEGAPACLTVFNTNDEYVFTESMIHSKSKNTPFIGKTLKGRVAGIINKGITTLY
jgi:dihydroorotase